MHRSRRVVIALAAAALPIASVVPVASATPPRPAAQSRSVWPSSGQAAYAFGAGRVHAGPDQHVAPIASMAKTMTADVVLRAEPLPAGTSGFRMTVTRSDVDDWRRRVNRGESTVAVRVGERITERQALAALLLPSANNIAIMLAKHVAGSVASFVAAMNRRAGALRMRHTTYSDPSGFDARTVSTPADQLVLARSAMQLPTVRSLVATVSYPMPYVGTIHNTDTLLGTDGFVGIKTGSDDAAGGCLMFLSHRLVRGRRVDMFGVVMGQAGSDELAAGLAGAKRLVDRVAPPS